MNQPDESLQKELAQHLREVQWHGTYFSALCEDHDDHRSSLLVYPDGAWCAACRKRTSLAKLYERVKYQIVCEEGSYRFQWETVIGSDGQDLERFVLNSHRELKRNPSFQVYYAKRKVKLLMDSCLLGWYEGWYVVPILGNNREISGVTIRASREIERMVKAKYLVPPNQKLLFIPEWNRVQRADKLFVPFGIFDALYLAAKGLPSACWTIGKNLSTHADLFAFFNRPIYALPDRGEEEDAYQFVERLDWRGHVVLLDYPADCKDPNDFAQRGKERKLFSQLRRYL